MALEDLLTYTEVDPNGRLTVTSPRVTFSNLRRSDDTYLYDDKGVGTLSGAFTHEGSFKITSAINFCNVFLWGWANVIDDLRDPLINGDLLSFRFRRTGSGTNIIFLQESVGGSITNSNNFNSIVGVQYWIRIIYDPTFGVFGKLTCEVYTDSSKTILVTTLSLALNGPVSFQYFYPCSSFNDGLGFPCDGFTEEWDLGEEVSSGRRRRMLAA